MRNKQYKHIFFDLDHTLFDLEKCAEETLRELYIKMAFKDQFTFEPETLYLKFSEVNQRLWKKFDQGKIDRETLRKTRFPQILKKLGHENEEISCKLADLFLELCPEKGHLIDHAGEVLEYLSKKYPLHIITNGFEEIQLKKLKNAGILNYFQEIITSERCGYRKPEKGIFEFAITTLNTKAEDCIMIGDSLEADMLGASNALIDNVFFNKFRIPVHFHVTHNIRCLRELKAIL